MNAKSPKNDIARGLEMTRRTMLASLAVTGAVGTAADALATSSGMSGKTIQTARHKTFYWEAGPKNGPLMIFVHGWPEIGLMWRAQVEAFAVQGWHCIAPDMRGYGASSAPSEPQAYALSEIVQDMIELHDHLGGRPAIWVGHDLGSPVIGALTAHTPARSRAMALISVPYSPDAFALSSVLPLVDRTLYPADQYPDGQWDYYRFYLTNFEQSVTDFNANIPGSLSIIYRSGSPASVGKVSRSALITRNGGWFGAAHRSPDVSPDPAIWPAADFAELVKAFTVNGFRPGNAWYLNDDANIAYAHSAPDGGHVFKPVLFIDGDWDGICDITRSHLGDPMREKCPDLTVTVLEGAHWLPLEKKPETNRAIATWLANKGLKA